MTAFRMIRHTLALLISYEVDHDPNDRPNTSKKLWTEDAISCYDRILDREYSSQTKDLKVREIEESALFKEVVGDCPCTHKCLLPKAHSM